MGCEWSRGQGQRQGYLVLALVLLRLLFLPPALVLAPVQLYEVCLPVLVLDLDLWEEVVQAVPASALVEVQGEVYPQHQDFLAQIPVPVPRVYAMLVKLEHFR